MARLIWSSRAVRDLVDIRAFVALHNPAAARGVAARIEEAVQRLAEAPLIGRTGRVTDTREWVVRRTPYLIVYRVKADTVEIATVRHGARQWPTRI